MNKQLKYIILAIITAITLFSSADDLCSTVVSTTPNEIISEINYNASEFTTSESSLFLPYKNFCVNVLCISFASQRTYNANKNHLNIFHVDNVFNSGIRHLVRNNKRYLCIRYIKSTFRLISLGKLII